MLLTKRSGDIIRVLIRFPQDKPVTTAIISDESSYQQPFHPEGTPHCGKNGSPLRVSVLSVSAV